MFSCTQLNKSCQYYLTKVQATNSTYWMSLKNGLNLGPSILAFVSKLQIRYCTTAQPKDFQKSGTIKLILFLEPFVEVVLKNSLSTKIVRQYKHTLHTPYFPVHILLKSELCRMYVLVLKYIFGICTLHHCHQ